MIFLSDFSPIKPDFGLFLWTAIIFIIFWIMMAKFAFGPIKEALKTRESDIQDALDEAKKARQEVANVKAENDKVLAIAREERSAILKEASETRDSIVNEAKNKAREEAQKIVTAAKQDIDNQKKAAITDLKNQAGILAIEIAEKLIRKELKGGAENEAFVKTMVDQIKMN